MKTRAEWIEEVTEMLAGHTSACHSYPEILRNIETLVLTPHFERDEDRLKHASRSEAESWFILRLAMIGLTTVKPLVEH